jgi:hypothetical protein
MDQQRVAGEPVDVLLRAFRQLRFRKTSAGMVRFSATLDRELGMPLQRALIRMERELLLNDIEHQGGSGPRMRTPDERRADALVALAVRLVEAQTGT